MKQFTKQEYDNIILFIRRLLVAAKKKTGYAVNIMETSHNRPTLPPRTVHGVRCLVDDPNIQRVNAWIHDMKTAALRDGLTTHEITHIEREETL